MLQKSVVGVAGGLGSFDRFKVLGCAGNSGWKGPTFYDGRATAPRMPPIVEMA